MSGETGSPDRLCHCELRHIEEIARTKIPWECLQHGLKVRQTIYAQCTACKQTYKRHRLADSLTPYVPYNKLSREETTENIPDCVEDIHPWQEAKIIRERPERMKKLLEKMIKAVDSTSPYKEE